MNRNSLDVIQVNDNEEKFQPLYTDTITSREYSCKKEAIWKALGIYLITNHPI